MASLSYQLDSKAPSQKRAWPRVQPVRAASRMLARLLSVRRYPTTRDCAKRTGKQASLPADMKLGHDHDDSPSVPSEPHTKASSLPRVASASINIPLRTSASKRSIVRLRRVPQLPRPQCGKDDGCFGKEMEEAELAALSAWRKQQQQCANCEQISFRSGRDAGLGAFCSLDCKTSHGYMVSVHVAVDEQLSSLVDTWVDEDGSPSSSTSPSSRSSGPHQVSPDL